MKNQKIKKSKKSMEGQKSNQALKMQENWLSVNQIVMSLHKNFLDIKVVVLKI